MVQIERRTPDELSRLLAEADWYEMFAEIAAFAPAGAAPAEAVAALFRDHPVSPRLDLARLRVVGRALAERYLAVLLQLELAYHTPRLSSAQAREAAAWFMRPFGTGARFYTTVHLTEAIVVAKETGSACSFAIQGDIFGSTMEEGLVAFDPAGVVGALFVGDED